MSVRHVSTLCLLFQLFNVIYICKMETIRYMSLERPVVVGYNRKYIPFYNITSRRHSRDDPKYYISIHTKTLIPLDNKIFFNIYFYKSWGNTHERTFFELHYGLCDFLNKNAFLGKFLKRGSLMGTCPFPAGDFHMENCTVRADDVPAALPFTKGRIYLNVTYASGKNLGTGYMDIEMKQKQIRKQS